jgi:quinolinate synthase
VLALADFIGSTAAILSYAEKSEATQFVVATESGILHEMKKRCPNKEFIPVPPSVGPCACNECGYMRLNTLEKLYNTLRYEWPVVELDEALRQEAKKPIVRMLELSK